MHVAVTHICFPFVSVICPLLQGVAVVERVSRCIRARRVGPPLQERRTRTAGTVGGERNPDGKMAAKFVSSHTQHMSEIHVDSR